MAKPKVRTRLPRKSSNQPGSHVISFRLPDPLFQKASNRVTKGSVHTYARSVFEAVLHA